eukprot:TRINITY_DN83583_c0_g1_i1.p1 TRINITY_DN83583_c0_g1~~TRINITY_DN83583_c0_g1_i1.p1  ORF type:complete len:777 (+),score=214.32 TRINITY_DN83583_c0_g1_i1:156-2486(+)
MDWLFGVGASQPLDPPVPEGHQAVDFFLDGSKMQVDVDTLGKYSRLFQQVQASKSKECPLDDFPGGLGNFRAIVKFLVQAAEDPTAQLDVNDQNVVTIFEAAWLLECPRLFDAVMASSYIVNLSSRRKVELLDYVLPFSKASSPAVLSGAEAQVQLAKAPEQLLKEMQLETALWQKTERAAVDLASQLDTGDFVLGPRLTTGSMRVCCEFLKMNQQRAEEMGFVASAFQPVASMWKNLTDKPLRAKVNWDSHLFALMCFRKKLSTAFGDDAEGLQVLHGEHEEDEEARTDIPEALCSSLEDSVLLGMSELVEYIQLDKTPPNWAALLIRTLLLNRRPREARRAFKQAFGKGRQVQELAWKPRPRRPLVPPAWLVDVAEEPEACVVLLRVLARYKEMSGEELCDILEHVLLDHFLQEAPNCAQVVLASKLVDEVVGACFDACRIAASTPSVSMAPPVSDGANDATWRPSSWIGSGAVLTRLRRLGARLFKAAFVQQRGFLPHVWPDAAPGETRTSHGGSAAAAASPPSSRAGEVDRPCRAEPIIIAVTGECLWDEGLIDVALLRPVMEAARRASDHQTLHHGRQVVMRILWHSLAKDSKYCPVARLLELWDLACWPLCEDTSLIREAVEYLKGTYRSLQAPDGLWSASAEEAMFRMFAALDLSKLPTQVLLSPWVPAQAQTVQLLLQIRPAEQLQSDLHQEASSAHESLKSVNSLCVKLANRLNIVEQRTVINKSQINDAAMSIEDHQRRRRDHQRRPPQQGGGSGSAASGHSRGSK